MRPIRDEIFEGVDSTKEWPGKAYISPARFAALASELGLPTVSHLHPLTLGVSRGSFAVVSSSALRSEDEWAWAGPYPQVVVFKWKTQLVGAPAAAQLNLPMNVPAGVSFKIGGTSSVAKGADDYCIFHATSRRTCGCSDKKWKALATQINAIPAVHQIRKELRDALLTGEFITMRQAEVVWGKSHRNALVDEQVTYASEISLYVFDRVHEPGYWGAKREMQLLVPGWPECNKAAGKRQIQMLEKGNP